MQGQPDFNIQIDITPEELMTLDNKAHTEGIQRIVSGAMIVKDDKFLILKRADTEDFMASFDEIPSGHIDPGETAVHGLIREVYEETGLQIKRINAYVGSFDYVSSSGKLTRQLNFLVEIDDTPIVLNPAEHSSYQWIEVSSPEFRTLKLSDETRRAVLEVAGKLGRKR